VAQLAPVLFMHQLTVACAAAEQFVEEAHLNVLPSEASYQPVQVPPLDGHEAQARICLPPPQVTQPEQPEAASAAAGRSRQTTRKSPPGTTTHRWLCMRSGSTLAGEPVNGALDAHALTWRRGALDSAGPARGLVPDGATR